MQGAILNRDVEDDDTTGALNPLIQSIHKNKTMSAITDAQQFESKVKKASLDQLLIFHSPGSDPARVNRYRIIALATAVEARRDVEVLTVDIEACQLADEDVLAYQMGDSVICCTTINDGVIMEKALNPFERTVECMVMNILI